MLAYEHGAIAFSKEELHQLLSNLDRMEARIEYLESLHHAGWNKCSKCDGVGSTIYNGKECLKCGGKGIIPETEVAPNHV